MQRKNMIPLQPVRIDALQHLNQAPQNLVLQSIFEEDDQMVISESKKYPHSAIGLIIMSGQIYYYDQLTQKVQSKSFSGKGTGTLIESNIILTCAHNIIGKTYTQNSSGINQPGIYKIKRIMFLPGYNGKKDTKNPKYFISENFFIHDTYFQKYMSPQIYKKQMVETDLAMIFLDEDIAKDYGKFEIEGIRPHSISWNNLKLNICGYPGTKMPPMQYLDSRSDHKIVGDAIYHRIDTVGGNSGSPIYYQKYGVYYIVAVHTRGFDPNADYSEHFNSGSLLTEKFIEQIDSLIEKHGIWQEDEEEEKKKRQEQIRKKDEQRKKNQEERRRLEEKRSLEEKRRAEEQDKKRQQQQQRKKRQKKQKNKIKQDALNRAFDIINSNWKKIGGKTFQSYQKAIKAIQKINWFEFKDIKSQDNITFEMQQFYNSIRVHKITEQKPLQIDIIVNDGKNKVMKVFRRFYFQLKDQWKDLLKIAVQRINEAVPGIRMKIISSQESKSQSKIFINGHYSDSYSAFNIWQSAFRLHPSPQIFLKNNGFGDISQGIGYIIHEILHALGFTHGKKKKTSNNQMHAPKTQEEFDKLVWMIYKVYYTRQKRKEDYQAFKKEETMFKAVPFDPYGIIGNLDNEDMPQQEQKILRQFLWNDKPNHNPVYHLSELDKISLNLMYPPVITEGYLPQVKNQNGLYYCGRTLHDSSNPQITQVQKTSNYEQGEVTYVCREGKNCPSCRVLVNDNVQKLLSSGKDQRNRWQGWSGEIYCSKVIRNGVVCGPNSGRACEVCQKLIKGKF